MAKGNKTAGGGTIVKSVEEQAKDKAAKQAAKATKFVTLAKKRVSTAIAKVLLIGNLSNRSGYEYSVEQIGQIEKALDGAVGSVLGKFKAALEGKKENGGTGFDFQ